MSNATDMNKGDKVIRTTDKGETVVTIETFYTTVMGEQYAYILRADGSTTQCAVSELSPRK